MEKIDLKSFSAYLSSRRKELNLTSSFVASKLGVTSQAVFKYEHGTSFPDVTLIGIYASILEVDLDSFLQLKNTKNNDDCLNYRFDSDKFAKNLSFLRKYNNYTLTALQDKIGVQYQTISRWENEQGLPSINQLISLSNLYNVSVSSLFFGIKIVPVVTNNASSNNKRINHKWILPLILLSVVLTSSIITSAVLISRSNKNNNPTDTIVVEDSNTDTIVVEDSNIDTIETNSPYIYIDSITSESYTDIESESSIDSTTDSAHDSDMIQTNTYNYYINGDSIEIVNILVSSNPVVIPDNIDGINVTKLAKDAFSNPSQVTNIVFPTTISEFENGCLSGLNNLKEITIGDNANTSLIKLFGNIDSIPQNFDTIKYNPLEEGVFTFNTSFFAGVPFKYIIYVPEGTLIINQFYNATMLKEVVLPASVSEFYTSAFENATSLEKVVLDDATTFVGWSTFKNCIKLKDINLENVDILYGGSFEGCKSLTDVDLPNIVTIGRDTFNNSGIVNITLGDNLETIGDRAFLKTPIEHINLPSSLFSLGASAFQECVNLKEIVIPDGITYIPDNCFLGCTSLEYIVLPKYLDGIGTNVFGNGKGEYGWCTNLKKIFYKGDAEAFENIEINCSIEDIDIYYFSENMPSETGLYWHYDADNNIVIW